MFVSVKHCVGELGGGLLADSRTCTCNLEDLNPRLRKLQQSGAEGAGCNPSAEAVMDRLGVRWQEGLA